jgi:predicted TIM-barrel fold metal-dependent hydrolase
MRRARALIGGLAQFSDRARALGSSRVIDTHHHMMSPTYATLKRDLLLAMAPGSIFALEWTPERSIEEMDRAGVARSILSVSTPGVWFGSVEEGRSLARDVNEYGAQVVADHSGRFGFFASLPLPDTEGSLREIVHAFDTLHADGVVIMSNYDNRYLGDSEFAPVLAELDRRGAVVYVHPRVNTCCGDSSLVPDMPEAYLEFPFDLTRTIAHLAFSGTLVRTRNIRWLFSHGGGALPMVANRLVGYSSARKDLASNYPDGLLAEFARLHFDTATIVCSAALSGLRGLVPDTQIVFGSGYPHVPATIQLDELRMQGLNEAQLAAIVHYNPARILPASVT